MRTSRTSRRLPESGPPSTDAVRRCTALLRERGYNEAVTAALAAAEANAFLAAGFTVRERLHLLAHELVALDGARRNRVAGDDAEGSA